MIEAWADELERNAPPDRPLGTLAADLREGLLKSAWDDEAVRALSHLDTRVALERVRDFCRWALSRPVANDDRLRAQLNALVDGREADARFQVAEHMLSLAESAGGDPQRDAFAELVNFARSRSPTLAARLERAEGLTREALATAPYDPRRALFGLWRVLADKVDAGASTAKRRADLQVRFDRWRRRWRTS